MAFKMSPTDNGYRLVDGPPRTDHADTVGDAAA
jgi:hypothetical protein